jgi:hypothetical protein
MTGVTAWCLYPEPNGLYSSTPGWGDLAEYGPGVTVPAGATRTFEVTETIPPGAWDYGTVLVHCHFGAPPDQGSPLGTAEAAVPGATGSAEGLLFHDRNGDDRPDGEGVADTTIVLLDQRTGAVRARTVTGTDGGFRFADLPAGFYDVLVVGPWKLVDDTNHGIRITAGPSDVQWMVKVAPGPVQPDPEPPPAVQGAVTPATTTPASLAPTGANVLGLLVLAGLLIGAGFATRLRRSPYRTHRHDADVA